MLPSCELAEVSGGLGNNVIIKLEHDAAGILTVNGDIELDPSLSDCAAWRTSRIRTKTLAMIAMDKLRDGLRLLSMIF